MPESWGGVDYPRWMGDAACARTDPEVFFPDPGGANWRAKHVCASCPVQGECLEYALGRDELYGIWGGMSEMERRRLRRGGYGA